LYPYMTTLTENTEKNWALLKTKDVMQVNVPNRESFLTKKSSVKDKIERLVMQGSLEEARVAIKKYEELVPNDAEIYSIKAVMYMLEDRVQEAEKNFI
jgi:uncharacterized protein (DUF2344 family)